MSDQVDVMAGPRHDLSYHPGVPLTAAHRMPEAVVYANSHRLATSHFCSSDLLCSACLRIARRWRNASGVWRR